MGKNTKILLGVFTFLPIILFFLIFGQFFSMFMDMAEISQHHPEPDPEQIIETYFTSFFSFFGYIILIAITSLALFIIYLVLAINNKNLNSSERTAWILAIIFAGHIGYILYWIIHVWNYKVPEQPQTRKID